MRNYGYEHGFAAVVALQRLYDCDPPLEGVHPEQQEGHNGSQPYLLVLSIVRSECPLVGAGPAERHVAVLDLETSLHRRAVSEQVSGESY